jgi:redox-sensitive bicupin YhaK (pirin superfamily)
VPSLSRVERTGPPGVRDRRESARLAMTGDEVGPERGRGRPHPHINLATLTYLFEGEILHRDSLGTEQTIQPGAVNWMRAGCGIVHSERTSEQRRQSGQRLFGIQTWIALPEDREEDDPAFLHHGAEAPPMIDADGVRARLIAGSALGQTSPLQTASETLYADVQLARGRSMPIDPGYEERALYTISGEIEAAGESFEPAQLLVLRPGDAITVRASDARFMLFGGAPMGGPRYIWWNFVSSRRERIEAAKEEWAKGRFDTVPGDEVEFIPLPDNNDDPQRAAGGVHYP